MIFNDNTAQKTAELLLQINAIKLNPKNPFTWASGWKSPIYCDNRITLSFPEIRTFLKNEFATNIVEKFGKPDYIAGVATCFIIRTGTADLYFICYSSDCLEVTQTAVVCLNW